MNAKHSMMAVRSVVFYQGSNPTSSFRHSKMLLLFCISLFALFPWTRTAEHPFSPPSLSIEACVVALSIVSLR